MNSSLISCIIPVFNGERYLAETLDAVFAQTWRPIEVIVVDDGSTDRSRAIAEGYGQPVKVLAQANAGHAAARNLGLTAANGEFVAFVDADDLWEPAKLSMQIARFDARPELGVVFTHLQNFWSPDVDESSRNDSETLDPIPGYTSVTMLARRELFDRVGTLDVTLKHGNDRDWFCRAAEQGVVMEMMPETLVRRRLHGANRSAQHGASSRSEYLRILKASLDRRRNAGNDDVAQYGFTSTDGKPK